MNEMNEMKDDAKVISMPEAAKPKYTLRNLAAKDVFPMVKILGKIGLNEFSQSLKSDEVKQAIRAFAKDGKKGDKEDNKKANDAKVTAVGMAVALDIANIICLHIGNCEMDIYSFLGSLSGMSAEEIKELPMNIFLNMIVDVIKNNEFKDFFKAASTFIK